MRIGFDARAVRYRGGIGIYSRNLLRQFADFGEELVIFCEDQEKAGIPQSDGFKLVSANTDPVSWGGRSAFRALVKESKVDLLHVPSPWAPTPLPVPLVSTMHDVTPFLDPGSVPLTLRIRYKRQLHRTLEESRRVIMVSQILFSALGVYAHIDPAKARVIHNGVSARFGPNIDEKTRLAARHRHSLPERFAFWAGDFRPEKNLSFLVRAWSRLQNRFADAPDLVLAGQKRLEYRNLIREVESSGLAGRVHFPGFIPDEDLPAVYSEAELFVFPSLYEGFGLPPLEAMACGTPCVVSNSSSLPEVTGSAALLFNPTSLDDFEDCVVRVLTQPDLRDSLREAGLRRASLFSWRRAAEETIEVYRSALGESKAS
ncbi:MAG: glycosyltransferase family 4 protein [Thermoleophilia bacterium]|nr:glycosyltransferase family 4 protein [Thermoleophilia bacterium]